MPTNLENSGRVATGLEKILILFSKENAKNVQLPLHCLISVTESKVMSKFSNRLQLSVDYDFQILSWFLKITEEPGIKLPIMDHLENRGSEKHLFHSTMTI